MIVMVGETLEKINSSPEEEGLIIVGKMTSGIMHDVNNILTTIQGYATLLLKDINEEQKKQYIEIIQRCVCDGKEIVQRIKKLNVKKDNILCNVNIKEQIDFVIAMAKPIWYTDALATGKNISIIFNGDDSIYVNCIENELREALINLIINSCDAIEKNGSIVLTLYKNDDRAIIDIADTGCGIDSESVFRVFEPYFTTKGEKGNGLGLSMVKSLIEKMNGSIVFSSVKGEGSNVIISLPLCKKEDKIKIEQNNSNWIKNELKVLIVDDQMEVGQVIKEMLMALENIKAFAVTSSRLAYSMVMQEKIDLVIVDMIMPEINGIEFVEMAKKINPDSKYAIMTGYIKDENLLEITSADYILHKPFTIEEIKNMILELYI